MRNCPLEYQRGLYGTEGFQWVRDECLSDCRWEISQSGPGLFLAGFFARFYRPRRAGRVVNAHTEKYLLNLVKSNQIQIVVILFRLILIQTDFQSGTSSIFAKYFWWNPCDKFDKEPIKNHDQNGNCNIRWYFLQFESNQKSISRRVSPLDIRAPCTTKHIYKLWYCRDAIGYWGF